MLVALLRHNGHRVECATSLVAGLQRGFHPEVVLLDTAMPQKEAMVAVRRLKNRFPEAKVLAVGGRAGKGRREDALSFGFDGYFAKPVRANALEQAIGQLLGEAG